jgi:lysylphosphatidylglycerol synthetase-like protein (DUF2156 family)
MLRGVEDYFSPLIDSVNKLRRYLSDCALITDLTSKLVITFGVVLMIGGLYLMITDPSALNQAAQSMVSTVGWVPGIPFYIGNLANSSASTAGLIAWLVGLDLLLVGLGLWVRHKLARFTATIVFGLAAFFQFIQFLDTGIIGSPSSAVGLCVDAILVYFLLSKFDSPAGMKKQLIS